MMNFRTMIDITKFIKLVTMTQSEMKDYLFNVLTEIYGRGPINEDGFLYMEGNAPVMLVAHMDTVFDTIPEDIIYNAANGTITSTQGLGGDDRCGIYMILDLLERGLRPYVLFTEDEETGCVGADKFAEYGIVPNVKYMVEFDRKGRNECVFYDCHNTEFIDYVESFGFGFNTGSSTDIKHLSPVFDIASVNLSCGYYKAHHYDEYVVLDEMAAQIDRAYDMITDIDNSEWFDFEF